ncbi:membrane-associated guanylate kinase, WW and PDZ domain-containing protein 3 [Brachionichthys hirsutus]|uniref:membrane-associated guanylate kinase, WW and PDZ domain-containing protein 3 n=1 Tax=Brachionichthys hirsutus TaxID=412623 RepID=UPI0036046F6E
MYIDAFKRILYERLSCLKRMCVCQRQGSSFAMSKTTAAKKLHWRSNAQDGFVPSLGSSGEVGLAIGGGADYGEFPFVTSAPPGRIAVGDVILEIGGTPVLGMTVGDVRGIINSCPHPIRIKTVAPGSSLCKDLRLYLSKCFAPGSVDSQLQQVIRGNLYLRAVPCTTRQPRDGEVSGVDYNFVCIEEFFSLEESGALLESGKFKGNYYGTPRPVHISPESPPITYQEHRNLLRNFRTRSKSLSHLEKAVEDGEDSEDDSGVSGGSAGISSGVPPIRRFPGRLRASIGGDVHGVEDGVISARNGARMRGMMPHHWEFAFSDPLESNYIDQSPKRTSWQSPRASSREAAAEGTDWFTDQPGELGGFPVHAHLTKSSRGFGFNIVGGSRPRQFLQVYSVTSSGPSALKTADVLVFVGDVCVLGVSHKEVVEVLKSVPVGHGVDVEVRRGYPMLYNHDGRPKRPPPMLADGEGPARPPTTTQPRPRFPSPSLQTQPFNGVRSDGSYTEPGLTFDANGNGVSFASGRSPFRRSSLSNGASSSSSPVRPPRLARLQSFDPTLASQSDSEVVSHRASMIRNHNNNSLSAPPHPFHYAASKSSESDLSACTLSGSRLPLPHSPGRPAPSPGVPHTAHSGLFGPQASHLRPPPSPEGPHCRSYNGFHGDTSPTASPGNGGLAPVALAQSDGDRGLGFSVTAGGPGGRTTVVKRVWDRRQCSSLQPGDAIVKINGADVQSLSSAQVQTVLQEHTRQGDVVLLVHRGGVHRSPGSDRRLPPPLLHPPPPPAGSDASAALPEALPVPRRSTSTPPSPAPTRSSLIQSTSFLESIPVTLTMEPKDWINTGLEDDIVGGVAVLDSGPDRRGGKRTPPLRGFDVELRRKPGEGFGFVIASQDVETSKAASLLPHRFVTVRRGSPAAKSGQIRPGDRLEAVEGRPVASLPHRELAQILRRAGNTLRLTIIPRPSTYSSSVSGSNDFDAGQRSRKAQRSRPKHDSRYYSADLDRGPSGFGFSLRGGSEYNMGLYVLGLMEGGPASRSQKMQVSDQLVEINGASTAGMTHSQAVEHIRRGGRRIHLVLKRGNGYVPDYGREHRITSSSLPRHPKEQGLAALDSTGRKGHSSEKKRRSGSSDGRKAGKGTGRRIRSSEEELQSGIQSPISARREGSQEDRVGRRRRKRGTRSLPRDALRNSDRDAERGTARGRRREKEKGRSKSREKKSRSKERVRRAEGEENEQEEEQEEAAVEEAVEEKKEEEPEEVVNLGRGEEEARKEELFLPVPNPNQKLPRPKQMPGVEEDERGMAAEYRELRSEEEQEEQEEQEESGDDGRGVSEADDEARIGRIKRPLPGFSAMDASQSELFTFLASSPSAGQSEDDGTDSGDSQSESMSAASISGLSLAELLPGPWLRPGRQGAARVPEGRSRPGIGTEEGGRRKHRLPTCNRK